MCFGTDAYIYNFDLQSYIYMLMLLSALVLMCILAFILAFIVRHLCIVVLMTRDA